MWKWRFSQRSFTIKARGQWRVCFPRFFSASLQILFLPHNSLVVCCDVFDLWLAASGFRGRNKPDKDLNSVCLFPQNETLALSNKKWHVRLQSDCRPELEHIWIPFAEDWCGGPPVVTRRLSAYAHWWANDLAVTDDSWGAEGHAWCWILKQSLPH